MIIPKPLEHAPRVWREWSETICKAIIQRTTLAGKNTTIDEGTDGQAVNARPGGAGGESIKPLQIVDASNAIDGAQVRIYSSTLAGDLADGFSPGDVPPYYLPVSDGDLIIGDVETDADGAVTSRSFFSQASVDADSDTSFEVVLGSVSVDTSGDVPIVTCSNAGYGPIGFARCRNFYSSPPTYSAQWTFGSLA